MPLSWSEIKENWIKDFRIAYSRRSIETAFNTIISQWDQGFLENYKNKTSWRIVSLIDTGLLLYELSKIEDSQVLIARLRKGDRAAYSEARIATHFFHQGYEVRLQPIVDGTSRLNDVAVKVDSEWVNIEVKTPQRSYLQKELEKTLHELFQLVNRIPISRDVHLFLTKEPTYEEQKAIETKAIELAIRDRQPAFGDVNQIAYIRTDITSSKPTIIGTRMIGSLTIVPSYPEPIRAIYEEMPVLFSSGVKFDTSENGINIQLTIHVPFEDHRIISLIEQKRRQLSPDSMNMVALDTAHIPIKHHTSGYNRWIKRLEEAFRTKLSRRIGAVLFFSMAIDISRVDLKSSLYVNPDPYKRLPLRFLKKCDLNSYAEYREQ